MHAERGVTTAKQFRDRRRMRCATLVFVAASFAPVARSADAGYPRLFFIYGSDHDLLFCPTDQTPGAVPETLSKLANVQATWDTEAPPLLADVVALVGKPFARREVTA